MSWNQDEEIYLHSIQKSCESLSNQYLDKHRKWRLLQAKIKIPVIVIGSFTGITSFGTETFPLESQKWISVGVGVITVGIAILNTIESYFKIGESANAALNASNALQQLREDINKELSIPEEDRQSPGITFLRDCFTRYQQILNQAPTLDHGKVNYIDALITNKINVMIKRNNKRYLKEEEEIDKHYGGRRSSSGGDGAKRSSVSGMIDRLKGIVSRPKTPVAPSPPRPLTPLVALETVKEGMVLENGFLNTEMMKAKLASSPRPDVEASGSQTLPKILASPFQKGGYDITAITAQRPQPSIAPTPTGAVARTPARLPSPPPPPEEEPVLASPPAVEEPPAEAPAEAPPVEAPPVEAPPAEEPPAAQ